MTIGGRGDFVANVLVLGQNADLILNTTSSEFSNNRNILRMFGSSAIEMFARAMTNDLHQICDKAVEDATIMNEIITVSLDTKGINFVTITAYPTDQ